MRASSENSPSICPHCDRPVPPGASACPHCGSDAETGWSDDADRWDPDLPTGYRKDENFDYEAFLRREFSSSGSDGERNIPMIVAVILFGLFVLFLLYRMRVFL